MDNLTLSQVIKNNIRVKNLEGNRDIVIYSNESGASGGDNIALEIGATYEVFISSAIDENTGDQWGQQKITIKLIPAEIIPNNYDLYALVNYFDVADNSNSSTFIQIYKYDTELWNVSVDNTLICIYKIVKKAV